MSSERRTISISEVGRVVTGKTPSGSRPDFFGGSVPFVCPPDFVGQMWISSTERTLSEEGAQSVRGSILTARSVLVTCIGSDMGKAAIARSRCVTNQQINAVVVDEKRFSPEFLYYELSRRKDEIRHLASGSAQPILNKSAFSRIQVPAPALGDQRRIVEVLSPLDDRIALLRETNATLEAIAQALFKSWFVDFDPVRAKSQGLAPAGMDEATAALFPDGFEESAHGAIPIGWRWVSLRDVVAILDSKRVPLSGQERAKRKGPFAYYGAAALMDHVDNYLFDGVHLLVGEDGSVTQSDGVPVLQYVWGQFWVNNHAHVLQGANGICTEHVLLSLRSTNIQHLVTGAVQAKLSQGNMWRIEFMRPSLEVSRAFADMVEPLFARLRLNAEHARSLAEARDTLLPRLISGQLRLPQAEEAIAEASHAD